MKRIISFIAVLVIMSLSCIPVFAADNIDVSGVDVLYNNKIDYKTGFAAFTLADSGYGPIMTATKKDGRFNINSSINVNNMNDPVIYATFYNSIDVLGVNGVYTGKYNSWGGASNGGRLTYEFTFDGQNDNYMKPDLVAAEVSYLRIFDGEQTTARKYIYIQPEDLDLTISVSDAQFSTTSKYFTYKISFDPDLAGVPFDRIRFTFRYPQGGYHFVPGLRGISCNYISENEYKNSLEAEKEEANESGNGAVDDLTGALGGVDNEGFLSAFKNLAASMSYDGTDAKWEFPALSIPAIAGVTDKIELSESQDIDLVAFVDDIPENILTLIRAVFDIALIIFCVRELYSLIQYLLTLKGGRSDE